MSFINTLKFNETNVLVQEDVNKQSNEISMHLFQINIDNCIY